MVFNPASEQMEDKYKYASGIAAVPNCSNDSHSSIGSLSHLDQVDDIADTHQDEVKDMTQRETDQIHIWKALVLFTIVITACLVSAGAYVFLEQGETENYRTSVSPAVRQEKDCPRLL